MFQLIIPTHLSCIGVFLLFVVSGAVVPVPTLVKLEWADDPIIILEDSLLVDFQIKKHGNVLETKEILWCKVQQKIANEIQTMKFMDFENIEKKPWIEVVTFDSTGRKENVGEDNIHRESSSEDPQYQYNIYVNM